MNFFKNFTITVYDKNAKKKGLSFETITLVLLVISFLAWFLTLKFLDSNIKIFLIFWIMCLIILILDVAFFSLFLTKNSAIRALRIRALLKTFSYNADLVSESKPARWAFETANGYDIITLKTQGILSKTEDVSRRLNEFLVCDNKESWVLDDVLYSQGLINMYFKHYDDERLIIDDLSKIERSDYYKIGITQNYSLTTRTPFTLLTGATGTAKSTTLKAFIIQFLATGLTDTNKSKNIVFTIDFKGSFLYNSMNQFAKNDVENDVLTTAKTAEEALQIVDTLSKIITDRYDIMNQNKYEDRDLTFVEMFPNEANILLVVDELLSGVAEMQASDKLKKPADRIYPQFFARLLAIINKGRAASVFGIISGQILPVSIMSSEARDSATTRLVLGNISQSQSQEMFKMGLNELPVVDSKNFGGRLFLDGKNWTKPKAILAPYFDETKLSFKKCLAELTSYKAYDRAIVDINDDTKASIEPLNNDVLNFNAEEFRDS